MSSTSDSKSIPVPPPPPPPPPQYRRTEVKLRSTPLSQHFFTQTPKARGPAPTGPYFFYGSLLDPCILVEILGLDTEPELRPAYLEGFASKLWGQYPALVESPDSVVEGAVYNVQTVVDAQKLADYETRNYTPVARDIRYSDGRFPTQQAGHVFVFDGNPTDLSEGTFDLRVWLKRVGRQEALDKLDARKSGKGNFSH
ncbi:uncharacterized protein N7498_001224 [Penicillium cinerascens]|uniref:Putative gamma-glutamylcyclotransferase n=1 Tax=Penicillium cinerascens TaxID=70096 RepID=A0A9W9TEZ9_9EURO|nr:uncharacterized protein N7498_001224 [Penicillium cinerascens]KAJ5219125.1 hypothetical protein N7498_001224 [Penicillium cinerascens]